MGKTKGKISDKVILTRGCSLVRVHLHGNRKRKISEKLDLKRRCSLVRGTWKQEGKGFRQTDLKKEVSRHGFHCAKMFQSFFVVYCFCQNGGLWLFKMLVPVQMF